jgi:serine/threonine-protein kinase
VIGRSIGNYKIVRVLGEGGMGTVYLAEHPMIGKRVAVKMLRPDLGSDPGLVSRFFQEAKAVNDIRHPNIVDISDFGHTEDGTVYFVMELMEGESLRDRLSKHGPMPVDQVVETARQVIDALAAAHRMGIIHRDLKPDNIFLIADSQAPGGFRSKLFDFGVAKLVGDKQQQVGHKTIDGAVVGTPFYMSPEQALCQDVTATADIYTMGVVMYEMLTGTVPFRSEQLVLLLNAILKQPAPPPSRERPEVPSWLDHLILRCLEKDPEARPRSMEEVNAILAAGALQPSVAGAAAFGATLVAPVGVATAPRPSTMARATAAATAVSRPPTAVRETASAPPMATIPPPQTAIRGGVARSAESAGTITRVRAYLDTRRVQRIAIPLFVVVALTVVATIFFSSASTRPVSGTAPEAESAPAAQPQHVSVHLNSEPAGAEVLRLNDNRLLGTTPVVDIRPVDGRQINYRFHLAGFIDVQMPFQATAPGRYEVAANLSPIESRPESEGRGVGASGRRSGRGHERKSTRLPTIAAGPREPVEAPSSDVSSGSALPPLGERNPVHRLGH